ncbi:MAG: hypothetical protein AAGL98_16430, partial [Planctomycetota bacterium]
TVPVDFIAGSKNQIFYPETSLRTYRWLKQMQPDAPSDRFSRHVFRDYGHMDLFVGKTADADVTPYLMECLARRDANV